MCRGVATRTSQGCTKYTLNLTSQNCAPNMTETHDVLAATTSRWHYPEFMPEPKMLNCASFVPLGHLSRKVEKENLGQPPVDELSKINQNYRVRSGYFRKISHSYTGKLSRMPGL